MSLHDPGDPGMRAQAPAPAALPAIGCAGVLAALLLVLLLPFLLADVMQEALLRLHLDPGMALAAVIGIFAGSLINIPVYTIERHEEQVVALAPVLGLWGFEWLPRLRRVKRSTVIAVNVGGCIVPAAIAAWEINHLVRAGGWAPGALAVATAANVLVCYLVARPVHGVGIAMPGFTSPLVAVIAAWSLLPGADLDAYRAPVAFVAGVLGPLLGADLLHLRDVTRISAGVLSIGGAGTFDGIVLSGVLAALLA